MAISETVPETISKSDRSYDIRKPDDSHRYPVTSPVDVLSAADIQHKEDTAVGLDIDDDGCVSVRYSADVDAELTVSATRYHNTGELRVPSAVGAALEFGDAATTWRVDDSGSGTRTLVAETTAVVDEVDTGSAEPIEFAPLDHITQDIDADYGSWSQEQFRLYLPTDTMAPLGWATNEEVRISVAHRDGVPALVFEPAGDDEGPAVRKASETGSNQADATLTVPNALVRGFGFFDTVFMWTSIDETLVAVPRNWDKPF